MKALVLAAALAALSSTALASAQPAASPQATATVVAAVADSGRLGWAAPNHAAGPDFDAPATTPEIDSGALLIALGLLAAALARPLGRALRRHEQHRRATALASTLDR